MYVYCYFYSYILLYTWIWLKILITAESVLTRHDDVKEEQKAAERERGNTDAKVRLRYVYIYVSHPVVYVVVVCYTYVCRPDSWIYVVNIFQLRMKQEVFALQCDSDSIFSYHRHTINNLSFHHWLNEKPLCLVSRDSVHSAYAPYMHAFTLMMFHEKKNYLISN